MSIIIQMETTLDVVAKQKALVQEALGPDGAYARLKENLEMLYENADIKAQDKATAIANGLSQFMVVLLLLSLRFLIKFILG